MAPLENADQCFEYAALYWLVGVYAMDKLSIGETMQCIGCRDFDSLLEL